MKSQALPIFMLTMLAVFAGIAIYHAFRTSGPPITVYKSASCGCCEKWVRHLRENGFDVRTVNRNDLENIKAEHGVTETLAACHTGLIDGYVVEGHVPADVIRRLLRERPEVRGIAVPGMPVGSPGMEGPNSQPYSVLTFDADGNTAVYEAR
jgi:hypothetical protein